MHIISSLLFIFRPVIIAVITIWDNDSTVEEPYVYKRNKTKF